MTNEQIKDVESCIAYQFKNKDLLEQAFTRRSYTEEKGGENNEVLEFIGDKALDLIVIKNMMECFSFIANGENKGLHLNNPSYFKTVYNEGEYTEIKKDLVNKRALSSFIDKYEFNKYLKMGNSDLIGHVEEQDSVKEDLFEAIIGAVAIDSNWNLEDLDCVIDCMIDFEYVFGIDSQTRVSYLEELETSLDQHEWDKGNYECIEEDNIWKCKLSVDCTPRLFFGVGRSKEMACNRAAKEAYYFCFDITTLYSAIKFKVVDPSLKDAINQLDSLFKVDIIDKPVYEYYEEVDKNNNTIWKAVCSVNNYKNKATGTGTTKMDAKRQSSYNMVKYIFENKPYMLNKQIRRIKKNEQLFDKLVYMTRVKRKYLNEFKYNLDEIKELEFYRKSSLYRDDLKANEQNLLPQDLSRNILEKDALPNLLNSIYEIQNMEKENENN